MKSQKAQIMIEFFLYVSIFILIVVSSYFLLNFIQTSEISSRESIITKELGESFKDSLTLAVMAGEGFRYNITFPKNILSKPYTVVFNDANATIIITWEGTYTNVSYPFTIPPYKYTFEGCLKQKKTILSNNCKPMLSMYNNGTNLIIIQEP